VKAIGLTEFGGPDVLGVLHLDEPHAAPGQVRFKVRAAGVNPSDSMTRSGEAKRQFEATVQDHSFPPPPHVVGWEAAGVIDEIGPGVQGGYELGESVVAITAPIGTGGAYVEHLAVPAASVARSPEAVDLVAASTLPLNGLTARLALDRLALPAGATLAVTGAAGALGGFVVQLAKADGLHVIGDASEDDTAIVAALGADLVVARGPDVARRIRDVVPDGAEGLVDCAIQDAAVAGAVHDGGAIVTLRFYKGSTERGIRWLPILVSDYLLETQKLERLCRQVSDGTLTLRVADVYPAEEAAQAHRRMETGGVRGRLVLAF
jgi:NADPH2:quinone reductase